MSYNSLYKSRSREFHRVYFSVSLHYVLELYFLHLQYTRYSAFLTLYSIRHIPSMSSSYARGFSVILCCKHAAEVPDAAPPLAVTQNPGYPFEVHPLSRRTDFRLKPDFQQPLSHLSKSKLSLSSNRLPERLFK